MRTIITEIARFMTSDPSLFIKRIRCLSLALIVSGAFNVSIISLLLYWALGGRQPTPYFELRPASFEQQQIPLADDRGCAEILTQLSLFSIPELINRLSHTQLIENGYAERDLALACLIAFHHFDIQRALPKHSQLQQQRLLAWKPKGQEKASMLVVYPDLTQQQFDMLIKFAKKERWPLTPEGLFLHLMNQKEQNSPFDDHLVETFTLTSEFWTVELLFNRLGQRVSKQEILSLLLEGGWHLLKQFVDQQRQVHDSSDARRQKFLLDYLKSDSITAAALLLKVERDFITKKLDDQQVISILRLMPMHMPEAVQFAKEMLGSPRSEYVWQQASQWLYMDSGETAPKEWNHHNALVRFVPEKASMEFFSKPLVVSHSTNSKISIASSTSVKTRPLKSNISPKPVVISVQSSAVSPLAPSLKTQDIKSTAVRSNSLLIYIVQEGDSLWKIAKRFGVKVDDIKKLNHIKSDHLKKGIALNIPKSFE